MMPMYCAMRKKVKDKTPTALGLSTQADYANDGIDGGTPQAVLSTLMQDVAISKQLTSKETSMVSKDLELKLTDLKTLFS